MVESSFASLQSAMVTEGRARERLPRGENFSDQILPMSAILTADVQIRPPQAAALRGNECGYDFTESQNNRSNSIT